MEEGATFNAQSSESEAGKIIFDPVNLTIASGGDIAPSTVVAALNSGNVDLSASQTININETIDSSLQTNSNKLLLTDENSDGLLTVNLNSDISLGNAQSLEGEANLVNVNLDSGGDIQDGLDIVGISDATVLATSSSDANISSDLTHNGPNTTLGIKANNTIFVSADIKSSTNKLNVTLNSDADANQSGHISIIDSTIETNGGDVFMGGSSSNVAAFSSSSTPGVYLSNSIVDSGSGDISLIGDGLTNSWIGTHLLNSELNTTGNGSISISGFNGTIESVRIQNSDLYTVDGDISLIGRGGSESRGVEFIQGSKAISSGQGNISFDGTAGTAQKNWQTGVGIGYLGSALIQTHDGDINIYGVGGTNTSGSGAMGIWIYGSDFLTTGDGDITIHGIGGSSVRWDFGLHARPWGSEFTNISTAGTGNINLIGEYEPDSTGLGPSYGIILGIGNKGLVETKGAGSVFLLSDNTIHVENDIASNNQVVIRQYNTATDIEISGSASFAGNDKLIINAITYENIDAKELIIGSSTKSSNLTLDSSLDMTGVNADIYIQGQNLNILNTDGSEISLNDATSFNFQATNNLTLNQKVTFSGSGNETIRFVADSDTNRIGSFNDTANSIFAPGMNVFVSGASANITTIDTSIMNDSLNGGDVQVTATNGDVNIQNGITTSSLSLTGNSGNAGNVNIFAARNINLGNSKIQAQGFSLNGSSGSDGTVSMFTGNSINGKTVNDFPKIDSSIINLQGQRVGSKTAPIGINKGYVFDFST